MGASPMSTPVIKRLSRDGAGVAALVLLLLPLASSALATRFVGVCLGLN